MLFTLAVPLLALASAQSIPARPSELDLKLKAAYVSFIKAQAGVSPAAREISRFYEQRPGLDLRFPDAQEFTQSYAGPGTPPLELIRAYYDPRLEVIVVPRTDELEGLSAETMPSGTALSKLLSVRAADILHESFHARLDKRFGFKVVNLMEDELLANWKEAQYLSRARPPSPELLKAADAHLRLDEAKASGLPPEKLAAVEDAEKRSVEKWGPDALDAAIKVARLKRGPAYFKRSILALYGGAGQGKPSVFTPAAAMAERLQAELARSDLDPVQRENLLVQLGLWSKPERLDKVRSYFRGAVPELFR